MLSHIEPKETRYQPNAWEYTYKYIYMRKKHITKIRKNTAYRAGWVRHRPGHRDTLPRHRQKKPTPGPFLGSQKITHSSLGTGKQNMMKETFSKTYSERYKIHSVPFYRGFVKTITAARPYTMRGTIWDITHQVPALCATQVKSWAGTTPEE